MRQSCGPRSCGRRRTEPQASTADHPQRDPVQRDPVQRDQRGPQRRPRRARPTAPERPGVPRWQQATLRSRLSATSSAIQNSAIPRPGRRWPPSASPRPPRFMDRTTNEWKDGDSLFLSCNVWRQAAENVAESLQRGMRVIVSGRLRQRSYETKEGEKRTVYEVEADEVGPSLRNASAKVTRSSQVRRRRLWRRSVRRRLVGPGGQGGYGGGGGGAQPTTRGHQMRPAETTSPTSRPSEQVVPAAEGNTPARSTKSGWPISAMALSGDRTIPLHTDHPRRRRGSAKEHHDGQATYSQA